MRDVVVDADGTRHVRYDRTYKGLRVLGGDFVARKDAAGQTTERVYWNGSGAVAVTSTSPSGRGDRRQSSRRHGAPATPRAATTGSWSSGRARARPRLAWDVVTTGVKADQTPSRLHTVVDADSGAVIRAYDEVKTGTGNSMYSGTVTLNTISSGSSWLLQATRSATTRPTSTARPRGTGTQFTDADDIWGNGSTSNRQTAGVDAQYGAEKTWDYYKNVQGRNGIWNNGAGARSRVHYGNAYVNAFWDGTADDLRRRRGQRQAAHLDRRGRPRDEPRRHREHRRT